MKSAIQAYHDLQRRQVEYNARLIAGLKRLARASDASKFTVEEISAPFRKRQPSE